MFSENTITIVKSTVPVLEIHGETITEVFYKNMFKKNPSLKDMFNMTNQKNGTQPRALADAVLKYGAHIDKLEALGPAVETIAQKHASLQVTPEMYAIVGENLLGAIKEVLGDAATDEIIGAWGEAYGALAAIFVSREESIYQERENAVGGFRGTKAFRIAKIVEESSVIKSFYLERADGEQLPAFQSGQYTTVQIEIPGTTHKHTRNYSLSNFGDNQYLRISVKKETGKPEGIVSNYLHAHFKVGDELQLPMPSGEFTPTLNTDKPAVLLAAGIGITPLLSMYKDLLLNSKRNIVLIHFVLNGEVQAFEQEIKATQNKRVQYVTVFSHPTDADTTKNKHQHEGYISKEILQKYSSPNSEFYFCGPTPFMAKTKQILAEMNVADTNIHFEFFGPQEDLETV